MNRRDLFAGLGGLAATAAINKLGAELPSRPTKRDTGLIQPRGFPRKADFQIAQGYTYISGAYTHPMPIAAAEAYRRSIERRATIGSAPAPQAPSRPDAKAAFAALINAKPNEISFVPNTSTGENLVVECLGIRKFDGNVVTDTLHFEGALIHLMELKKQGLDLRLVPARDGRIDMKDALWTTKPS